MDRTGARWSLTGAEAVLRLRALRASGDFDAYWPFHLEQDKQRNHESHYEAEKPRTRFPRRAVAGVVGAGAAAEGRRRAARVHRAGEQMQASPTEEAARGARWRGERFAVAGASQ